MVWLILSGEMTAAFWLFVAAGISDGVDGFLAKHFKAESVLGSYLDPIADKVMLVCIYVTLGIEGHIAVWLVILVVFRDALIVGGALLSQMLGRLITMKPLFISKVNTAAQILLAAVVLAKLGIDFSLLGTEVALEIFVGGTTLFSGAMYLVKWLTGSGEFVQEQQSEEAGEAQSEENRRRA
jgi:cardiolipin synthase